MKDNYVEKRAALKVLIMHLKGFNSLDDVEVPAWVRPAVKQWLAAGHPDKALAQLEGQLAFYESMKGDVSKDKLLDAMGLTRSDLAKHTGRDDLLSREKEQRERHRELEKKALKDEKDYEAKGREMKARKKIIASRA